MKKLILITIIILLAYTGYSYAGMDDKSDRLSNDQAGIFSPGYINAAKQKTENIINQSSKKKSLMENITDYVKNKMGNKVSEDALERPAPELKKKTSALGENAESEDTSTVIASTQSENIKIGSGTGQYKENGRIISEVIDGQRYVYAGFDNVGKSTIQDAVNLIGMGFREGTTWKWWTDTKVIVKAGTYTGDISISYGISGLYGGYNEAGVRNLAGTPSIINGSIRAYGYGNNSQEINGFTINGNSYGACISANLATNLIIVNNVFNLKKGSVSTYPYLTSGYNTGIVASNSLSILIKNNTFNTTYGLNVNSLGTSQIKSENNNFNGIYAITAIGKLTNVSSANDYFARNEWYTTQTSSGASVAIQNPSAKSNTQTASTAVSIITPASTILYELPYRDNLGKISLSPDTVLNIKEGKVSDNNVVSSIFKGLLANKGVLQGSTQGQIDPKMLAKIVKEALSSSTLAVPQTEINPQEMDIAIRLANIMKNPTEDQKAILDAMTALLNEVNKEIEGSDSPELKKVTDDLLQMVATILIAQAIPDLLKEGDVSNIKGIFKELATSKDKILSEYQEAVKPYYDEVRKILSKNMAFLQLNNIVSKQMMEQELSNLEPNEVDKILQKLRSAKTKSFEAGYIVQEEQKYHNQYINPNKQMLEDRMKDMMREFTGRLSRVLESTKK